MGSAAPANTWLSPAETAHSEVADPAGPARLAPADAGVSAADPPLAALLARCRNGDDDAFALLVEQCAERLFNFLLKFTGNTHDAEDLAQETFLKVHRSLARFDLSRAFLPWLFTIARRTALNHLRARRPTDPLPDEFAETETADNPSVTLADSDDRATLWRLARQLKPRQYEALWLCYGEGFNVAEIAAVLRTNSIYAKVLLHRARRALLCKLAAAGYDRRSAPP